MEVGKIFLDSLQRNKLLEEGDRVLVGVSGGGDSTCLLHLLMRIRDKYALELGVAYVNYLYRSKEETEEEESFVRGLSKGYGLSIYVKRQRPLGGSNIQKKAREIRLNYFSELVCRYGYNKVALGHNKDDVIENFLLRISRGSGLKGLVTFTMASNIRGLKLIRPLLLVERKKIRTFMKAEGYKYLKDSTNEGLSYKRNAIRLKVCKGLEGAFPMYREGILSTIEALDKTYKYMSEEAQLWIERLKEEEDEVGISLNLKGLKGLAKELVKLIIRRCYNMLKGKVFGTKHIEKMLEILYSFRGDGSKLLYRDYDTGIFVEYEQIRFSYLLKEDIELKDIRVGEEYKTGYGYSIYVERVEFGGVKEVEELISGLKCGDIGGIYIRGILLEELSITSAYRGEKICFREDIGLQSIKEVLINKKVCRSRRGGVLILRRGGEGIGILGYNGFGMVKTLHMLDELTRECLRVVVKKGGDKVVKRLCR